VAVSAARLRVEEVVGEDPGLPPGKAERLEAVADLVEAQMLGR
jgi:hypothetical protein